MIGHRALSDALSRAFERGKAPQTLLLHGPAHVGKTTLALEYARLLLCPTLHRDEGVLRACCECAVCRQIEARSFPDFRVFAPIISASDDDPAPEALDSSVITVNLARQFIAFAEQKALSGPRQVLLMPQCDRMTDSANNAMLKTLEEPPPGTFLVLTTENALKLPATILSRCWKLHLPPVPEAVIARDLERILVDRDASALRAAAALSLGCPGLAWRILQRDANNVPARMEQAARLVRGLDRAAPVGALRLTEEAQALAQAWWTEDLGTDATAKKLGSKGTRSAVARFLDVLSAAGRTHWLSADASPEARHSALARLDQILQTRQHILRNANEVLALNVMFARLIALAPRRAASSTRTRNSAAV